MPFKPLFLIYIVLCIIAFVDVLFTMRKNSMIKICILLIISSLFLMNYFSYLGTLSRVQIFAVKCVRIVYACSTMLIIVQCVTSKIPKWITAVITFSIIFLVGVRILYFDRIAVGEHSPFASQVFSVGPEMTTPVPFVRYSVYALVLFVTVMTFYFYRKFFIGVSVDDENKKILARWILLLAIPFFLLVIFGMMGSLHMYEQTSSVYLFSVFSFTVIFSIMFRPKMLRTTAGIIND